MSAILGIDGDKWYVSNDMCLGDPRAQYAFADTPELAIEEHMAKWPECNAAKLRELHNECLFLTVSEYKEFKEFSARGRRAE